MSSSQVNLNILIVLCSKSYVLEVIYTDYIIKMIASQKEKKIIYTNKIFMFALKKARNKFIN
jgi:hypothetical protein